MTDVVVDRLRIRGADGRRLATVAARSLPIALERAFVDIEDTTLGQLSVDLHLDPADYDDATLAVLWADRIRTAALAAGARPRAARPAGQVADPDHDVGAGPGTPLPAATTRSPSSVSARGSARADVDALAATVLAWLDAGGTARAVPVALAALADPVRAAAVAARLGPERTALLVRALTDAGARAGLRPGARPQARPSGPTVDAPDDAVGQAGAPAPPHPVRPATTPLGGAEVAEAAHIIRTAADFAAAADIVAADLAQATRVAGLVLLYPWLADLCRDAEDWHPGTDPGTVRRLALASLADPDDIGLADDPLVCFLAGAPADGTASAAAPSSALVPLAQGDRVVTAADAVLARFAALLPGFERSSSGFIRSSWVVRAGLLDTDHDARLLAETMPLDVVLPLLRYPVSLLRLPWTPPLSVRFVP